MTTEVVVGSVFGRLTVLRQGDRLPNGTGRTTPGFICQCECGSPPINVRVNFFKLQHYMEMLPQNFIMDSVYVWESV